MSDEKQNHEKSMQIRKALSDGVADLGVRVSAQVDILNVELERKELDRERLKAWGAQLKGIVGEAQSRTTSKLNELMPNRSDL